MAEKKEKKPNPATRKRFKLPSNAPVNLDKDLLFKLCESMLPVESIAIIMGCSKETLYLKYADVLHTARENRKKSLVTVMWEKALIDKDTKMMIWLSKQHLGYKDTIPENHSHTVFNVICKDIPKPQIEQQPIVIDHKVEK